MKNKYKYKYYLKEGKLKSYNSLFIKDIVKCIEK